MTKRIRIVQRIPDPLSSVGWVVGEAVGLFSGDGEAVIVCSGVAAVGDAIIFAGVGEIAAVVTGVAVGFGALLTRLPSLSYF